MREESIEEEGKRGKRGEKGRVGKRESHEERKRVWKGGRENGEGEAERVRVRVGVGVWAMIGGREIWRETDTKIESWS